MRRAFIVYGPTAVPMTVAGVTASVRAADTHPVFASHDAGNPAEEGTPADDVPPPEDAMIILGVILLVIGLVAGIGILWTIGIILVAVGVLLWILGAVGREVGGRRHYY
jgi:hypothetical protein